MTRPFYYLTAGVVLAGALAVPPLRGVLEQGMATHMLVQIPLLTVAGALLATGAPAPWRAAWHRLDPLGLAGLLIAGFTLAFWLLPRNLDLALLSAGAGWAKLMTLPLLAGAPLGLAWGRLPGPVRGLVWANATAMLFVMGWLYLEAPDRLCNSYLLGDQQLTGRGLLGAGILSLAAAAALAMTGTARPQPRRPSTPDPRNAGTARGQAVPVRPEA